MESHIALLTDLSYSTGIIGIVEYWERMQIALWLSDEDSCMPDPRSDEDQREDPSKREGDFKRGASAQGGGVPPEDEDTQWLHFLALNTWMFTIGDRDCYPSVPHGHHKSKMREWPKVNPYTGRVFSAVHSEDTSARLTRTDMKQLWSDSAFVEHCRKQVLWYSDFMPSYGFPSARRGRLVFPKWR